MPTAAGALVVWAWRIPPAPCRWTSRGQRPNFAVGCGYKYLNGGRERRPSPGPIPSTPLAWTQGNCGNRSRLDGHAAPFEFTPNYRARVGRRPLHVRHAACCPLAGAECGVDTVLAARSAGRHAGPAGEIARTHETLHTSGRRAYAAIKASRCRHRVRVIARQPGEASQRKKAATPSCKPSSSAA